MRAFRFAGVLFVSLFLVPLANGQALIDRVPDDAVAYVGWNGTDNLGTEFESSHLKAVLDSSDASQIVSDFIPKLLEKLGQQNQEPREFAQIMNDVIVPMWKHPTAVYFGGLDFTARRPMPKMSILCDAGKDAPAVLAKLQQLLQKPRRGPVPMAVAEQNGLVTFTVGAAMKDGGKLNALAAYKSAASKAQEKPVLVVYVNGERLVATIDDAIKTSRAPEAPEKWASIRQSLALDGFKGAIWTAGFDGKNWGTRAFVAAPAPRAGLMKLFDGTPISDDTFKLIPETAVLAGVGRLDLGSTFDGVRNGINAADPRNGEQFDDAVANVSGLLGVDVRNDLLAPIGDTWTYYVDPATGGSGVLGGVLINQLRDPAKAEQSFGKFEESANRLIRQQLRNEKLTIAFKQKAIDGVNVHYLATPLVTPAWAIKNGQWVVGLYPQVVAGATANLGTGGKSILDNPAFVDVRKRLGDVPATSLQFADLPKLAPSSYSSWLLVTRYAGVGDLFGINAPLMILPPMKTLLSHLSASGAVTWSTDEGMFMRSVSPFPMSQTISSDPLAAVGVAQPALLVSILLPSLNRARETANRVKCAANLKQIGNGMLLYSNENRGQAPPDLGTLIVQEDLTAQVFVCPSGGNEAPQGMKPEDQAKWANEHSDYVYIKPKKFITALNSDDIIVYEKYEDHDEQGINMLFADGHVEFYMLDDAKPLIEAQLKAGK